MTAREVLLSMGKFMSPLPISYIGHRPILVLALLRDRIRHKCWARATFFVRAPATCATF